MLSVLWQQGRRAVLVRVQRAHVEEERLNAVVREGADLQHLLH